MTNVMPTFRWSEDQRTDQHNRAYLPLTFRMYGRAIRDDHTKTLCTNVKHIVEHNVIVNHNAAETL